MVLSACSNECVIVVEYARAVRCSAEALLTVLNDVLDFSKLEAGKMVLADVSFDLRGLIEEVGHILCAGARAKHLELVVALDPAVPRFVRGDPARLRQILLNLASNAVKFTDHGEVELRVFVEDGPSTSSVPLRISVRDTGIGIRADHAERLFRPFVQVDASSTRRFGGSGLGLAISRELVTRMKGALELKSAPGVGSEFTVRVALERGSPGEAELTPDIRFFGRSTTCPGKRAASTATTSVRDYGLRVQNQDPHGVFCYPPESPENQNNSHQCPLVPTSCGCTAVSCPDFCVQPQIWMAAVEVDAQGGISAGRDTSHPAFWLPFQAIEAHNHIAQWVTSIPGHAQPDAGTFPEDGAASTDAGAASDAAPPGDGSAPADGGAGNPDATACGGVGAMCGTGLPPCCSFSVCMGNQCGGL